MWFNIVKNEKSFNIEQWKIIYFYRDKIPSRKDHVNYKVQHIGLDELDFPFFKDMVKKLKESFEKGFKTSLPEASEQIWKSFILWVKTQYGNRNYTETKMQEHIKEYYRRVETMFSFLSGSNVSIKITGGILMGDVELTIRGDFMMSSELHKLLVRDREVGPDELTPATISCPLVQRHDESWAHICLQMDEDVPLFDKVASVLMYVDNVDQLNREGVGYAAYWKYLSEHNIEIQANDYSGDIFYEFGDSYDTELFLRWKLLDESFEAVIYDSKVDISFHENEWKIVLEDIEPAPGEKYYYLNTEIYNLQILNFGLPLPEHLGEHGPLRQIDFDSDGVGEGNYRT